MSELVYRFTAIFFLIAFLILKLIYSLSRKLFKKLFNWFIQQSVSRLFYAADDINNYPNINHKFNNKIRLLPNLHLNTS